MNEWMGRRDSRVKMRVNLPWLRLFKLLLFELEDIILIKSEKMLGMDPEVANYMNERHEKQNYLKREIQEKNYNVAEFAQFLEWKKGKLQF